MKHPHPVRSAWALALAAVVSTGPAWPLTLDDSVSPRADVPIDASETPAPPRPRPIPLPDESPRRVWSEPDPSETGGYLPPTAVPVPSPYAIPREPASPVAAQAPEYEFDLVVRYGDLEEGFATFTVDHNALVTLAVDSDTLETVWIQDYNVGIAVQPGQAAMLRFRAERPGRFAIWYGNARHEIAILEVGPPAPSVSGPLPWSFE